MKKSELISYLDSYLKIADFQDDSKNWLQVDTEKKEINKIWYAVDATSYIFDRAIKNKCDMVIVHHWLFWWYDNPIVWVHYKRISKLIKNDIALYACHLPLDAHEEVGNNIVLVNEFIKYFKIEKYGIKKFWDYHGQKIWFWLIFDDKIEMKNLPWFCKKIWIQNQIYNFWNKKFINSLAVVSGWWMWEISQAKNENYDVFLTGEWVHRHFVGNQWAKEIWQSLLVWWHYETEIFGVKNLSKHLQKKFWVEIIFLDEKY